MKTKKPMNNIWKERLLAAGIGAAIMLVVYSGVTYWLNNNTIRLQSPIVIEKKHIIEPKPTNKPQVSPAPLQSPTSAPKVKSGLHIIPQVQAAEITPTVIGPKEYIIDKIHAVFGDAGDVAVAVARCESGLRSNAIGYNTNGSFDSGVFQINSIHKAKYEGRNILDVDVNIDVAYEIYKAQGFNPWVAYKSGCYKNFL